jgi:hypothetical protein
MSRRQAGALLLRQRNNFCAGVLQVVRRLDAVVAAESSPGDDGELLFVTRLLQLGAATKAQLRARRCCRLAPRSEAQRCSTGPSSVQQGSAHCCYNAAGLCAGASSLVLVCQ